LLSNIIYNLTIFGYVKHIIFIITVIDFYYK